MTELLNRAHEPAVPAAPYDLDDRCRVGGPPPLLTGVQAIARLLVEHRALDRRRGLKTASFVSGYQGSPLGGLDRMLADMKDVLDANDIRFVPGLNEELAATAVWGSQIDLPAANATHDGVTGFLCEDEADMVRALARLDTIDRRDCRAAAEQRFSIARMASDHERLYRQLIARSTSAAAVARPREGDGPQSDPGRSKDAEPGTFASGLPGPPGLH